MKFLIVLSFGLFLFSSAAFGQQTEIDSYCQRVDSTITASKNINEFIVRHLSDFDTTRLYDRYFIDTVNLVLLKSIYDGNYYANEYIEFYYRDTQLVRINARYELNDRKNAGVFYYEQGNLITSPTGQATQGNNVFDIVEIERTGKEYLRNSLGIFDLIRRNGKSKPNRRR